MLKIPINVGKEEWIITGDVNQYIISKKMKNKNRETGKITYIEKNMFFFSTLQNLIIFLFNQKIKASDATTLLDLQTEIRKAKKELSEVFELQII